MDKIEKQDIICYILVILNLIASKSFLYERPKWPNKNSPQTFEDKGLLVVKSNHEHKLRESKINKCNTEYICHYIIIVVALDNIYLHSCEISFQCK